MLIIVEIGGHLGINYSLLYLRVHLKIFIMKNKKKITLKEKEITQRKFVGLLCEKRIEG